MNTEMDITTSLVSGPSIPNELLNSSTLVCIYTQLPRPARHQMACLR